MCASFKRRKTTKLILQTFENGGPTRENIKDVVCTLMGPSFITEWETCWCVLYIQIKLVLVAKKKKKVAHLEPRTLTTCGDRTGV